MLHIVDYGMGNLRSVENALAFIGVPHRLTRDPGEAEGAAKLILPGVGSFRKAMDNLRASGMADAIVAAARSGTPLLGICLGMQLLAEEGEEGGASRGLGLIAGKVVPMQTDGPDLRIPHMGFNEIRYTKVRPEFAGVDDGSHFYFAHSYHLVGGEDDIAAIATHGARFAAVVARGGVVGTQFHPEKSQSHGLRLLRNFCGAPAC